MCNQTKTLMFVSAKSLGRLDRVILEGGLRYPVIPNGAMMTYVPQKEETIKVWEHSPQKTRSTTEITTTCYDHT